MLNTHMGIRRVLNLSPLSKPKKMIKNLTVLNIIGMYLLLLKKFRDASH